MNHRNFGIEVYEESPARWRYYLVDPLVGEDRTDRGWFANPEAALESAKAVVDLKRLRGNRSGNFGPGSGNSLAGSGEPAVSQTVNPEAGTWENAAGVQAQWE